MHRIRVDRHVAHDFVEQLEVGILARFHLVDELAEQIEHGCHVAVVLPQLRHEFSCVRIHVPMVAVRAPRAYRENPLLPIKPPKLLNSLCKRVVTKTKH